MANKVNGKAVRVNVVTGTFQERISQKLNACFNLQVILGLALGKAVYDMISYECGNVVGTIRFLNKWYSEEYYTFNYLGYIGYIVRTGKNSVKVMVAYHDSSWKDNVYVPAKGTVKTLLVPLVKNICREKYLMQYIDIKDITVN